MQYIVLDLEWNQPLNTSSAVFNRLPIRLRGEIIEIGAVKLNEDMTPGDEFQVYVKPIYFKKLHYKVKKLTGIHMDLLSQAGGFVSAFESFREWCGDGCVFLTWGYDDQGIFEQNIIIHDLDWDWIRGWVNLQVIYNRQVADSDNNQKALHTAMEHFGIEQTRVAHDALGDAYNTALVCAHLDLINGLANYNSKIRDLALPQNAISLAHMDPNTIDNICDLENMGKIGNKEDLENRIGDTLGENHAQKNIVVEHISFQGLSTRNEAFANTDITRPACPDCGKRMLVTKYVNQGDKRYMALCHCPEHRKYLVRLKVHQTENERWSVNRIMYPADIKMQTYYETKAAAQYKRGKLRR